MRIAFFSRSIPQHGGGGMERVSFDLMTELARAGHDVMCFTTPFEGELLKSKVDVIKLPGRAGRYSKKWYDVTIDAVRDLDADVIVGVSAGAHAIVAAGVAKVPVVMQAHGTALDEIITKLRIRRPKPAASALKNAHALSRDLRLYKRYEAVVAVGPAVADSIKRLPRAMQPARLEQIENGIPLAPRTPAVMKQHARLCLGIPQKMKCAVFVGRLHREKGVDIAIEAMRHWYGHLLIVGDGPERAHLQSRVDELSLGDRITFAGSLDRHGVAQALIAADALLAPSRRKEGLPTVVLEALMFGVPVIASSQLVSSLPSDLTPATLPADDGLQIARCLQSLDMREAAEYSLPPKYTLPESAARYLQLFHSLTEVRGAPAHAAEACSGSAVDA